MPDLGSWIQPGDDLETVPVAIAQGASLSGAVELGGRGVIRINMPAAWTEAVLTFQVSEDGTNYLDLYKHDGLEQEATAAADRAISVNPGDFLGFRYLKVRSGTAAVPVDQDADRALELVVRPL